MTSVNVIPEDKLPDFSEQMSQEPEHIRLALALMLHAGLRVGETTKLGWCDLVRDGQVLNAIRLEASMTKTKQSRDVPINRTLATLIDSCWRGMPAACEISPADYATAPRKGGRATSPRTLQRACKAIRERIGLARLTPHTLRHTFATRLLAVSNVAAVQLALGHARINTTQVYVHPNNEQLRTALEAMA